MRDRLTRFARGAGDYVPDATAVAILMILALFAAALALGETVATALDAFYRGLWMLLAFSMQMTLVLLLSTVVGSTPFFRRLIGRVAGLPRTAFGVIGGAIALSAGLAYFYWALSLALGPAIAAQFARAAEAKGVRVDFPCLLAAVYAAGSVWQYGLSSTPALLVATPGHFLEKMTGVMPLTTTIWAVPTLVLVLAFPVLLALAAWLTMPRDAQPVSSFAVAAALFAAPTDAGAPTAGGSGSGGIAGWSERTRSMPLLLTVLLGAWLYHHFVNRGLGLDLNSMVTMLLAGALLLTGTLAAFGTALQSAIVSCWQVVVLYQVYGGVAGLLQYTSVGDRLAEFFAALSTPATFPLLTAIAGTVVAVFVPSSGGQWIIQGFLTTEAAAHVGAAPQLGLLALGIGDQMGNLVSPFWIVVVAGLARIELRRIYGHVLVFSLLWFVLGVAAFTWVPGLR